MPLEDATEGVLRSRVVEAVLVVPLRFFLRLHPRRDLSVLVDHQRVGMRHREEVTFLLLQAGTDSVGEPLEVSCAESVLAFLDELVMGEPRLLWVGGDHVAPLAFLLGATVAGVGANVPRPLDEQRRVHRLDVLDVLPVTRERSPLREAPLIAFPAPVAAGLVAVRCEPDMLRSSDRVDERLLRLRVGIVRGVHPRVLPGRLDLGTFACPRLLTYALLVNRVLEHEFVRCGEERCRLVLVVGPLCLLEDRRDLPDHVFLGCHRGSPVLLCATCCPTVWSSW